MTVTSSELNGHQALAEEKLARSAPAGAILRFEDAQRWETGEAYAREAGFLLEDAKQRAATQLSEAREIGFSAGYAEGVREALALVLETKTATDDYRRHLQSDLTELVIELLKQVVGEMTPASAVAAAVGKALPALDLGSEVVLVVNPDAANEVSNYLSAHLDGDAIAKVRFREDARLAPRQARIESNFGSIDLSLDRQLELLAESLRSANVGIEQ